MAALSASGFTWCVQIASLQISINEYMVLAQLLWAAGGSLMGHICIIARLLLFSEPGCVLFHCGREPSSLRFQMFNCSKYLMKEGFPLREGHTITQHGF